MIDAVARERSRGFVPPRRNAHKGRAGSASARGCAHPLHASLRHLSATRGEELLLCNTMEPTIDLNLHLRSRKRRRCWCASRSSLKQQSNSMHLQRHVRRS